MKPNEIKDCFDRYIANEKKKSEMDKELFTIADKSQWVNWRGNQSADQENHGC